MQKIIVSDASCLILFYKIGELELLKKVFGKIIITEIVSKEFNRPVPDWIQIVNPSTNLQLGLQGFLDPGGATSILLGVLAFTCYFHSQSSSSTYSKLISENNFLNASCSDTARLGTIIDDSDLSCKK